MDDFDIMEEQAGLLSQLKMLFIQTFEQHFEMPIRK